MERKSTLIGKDIWFVDCGSNLVLNYIGSIAVREEWEWEVLFVFFNALVAYVQSAFYLKFVM